MSNVTDDQAGQLIRNYGWNGDKVLNTPLNLTYSFGSTTIPYWKPSDFGAHDVITNTFAPLSGPQKTAFEAAIKVWEHVADIHLNPEMPYIVDGELITLGFGDIVVVGGELINSPRSTTDASTISPTTTRSADSAGDIVFGNTGLAKTNNHLLAR